MHRGTRELDLVLGGFVSEHIATMKDAELASLKTLSIWPIRCSPAGSCRASRRRCLSDCDRARLLAWRVKLSLTMDDWNPVPAKTGKSVLARVPQGFDALVLGDLARLGAPALHVHVARDDQRMASLAEALAFFAPDIPVLQVSGLG